MSKPFKKIMIFGRPGSGKSTFALWLSRKLGLPLHHLDKHFFTANWVERDYADFLNIQENIINNDSWIIDGNSLRSLEMRFCSADLVLYFNYPRIICLFRILQRYLKPNVMIDDRATGCTEIIRLSLLKYMWGFEKRVKYQIIALKEKYPKAVFIEIKNDKDLQKLTHEFALTY